MRSTSSQVADETSDAVLAVGVGVGISVAVGVGELVGVGDSVLTVGEGLEDGEGDDTGKASSVGDDVGEGISVLSDGFGEGRGSGVGISETISGQLPYEAVIEGLSNRTAVTQTSPFKEDNVGTGEEINTATTETSIRDTIVDEGLKLFDSNRLKCSTFASRICNIFAEY